MSFFLAALMLGSGVIALWINARFPKLAPNAFSARMFAACGAWALLQVAPLVGGSVIAAYLTAFGVVLPTFTVAFLTAIWLLQSMRDAQQSTSS